MGEHVRKDPFALTSTADVLHLEQVYGGKKPYYGETHDHAATGGTSDGKRSLSHWVGAMEALGIDFASILDHRQVRHMYLPEWNDALFLCGTEPGTTIVDSPATVKRMHYNLHVPNAAALEDLLSAFPEYEFTGGSEGHFKYPTFTVERFGELIDALKERGGFFVHPHPTHLMQSDNPLDYVFREETAIEVFYESMTAVATEKNYKVWTGILAAGKRVWAIAGGDGHACCSDAALTTIYADEKTNAALLDQLKIGDFVCGPVGIRMCVGNTRMGGQCSFEGERLVLSIGDFHRSVRIPEHSYRVDFFDDKGLLFSRPISCTEPSYFALKTGKCRFYRAEVWDETRNLRIAIGNPIWNADCAE